MELGNAIFGNSRGEFGIPRDPSFEGPWQELCEELKISWRGEPERGCLVPETQEWCGVENDTFRIRTYDWDAECDCGADEKMEGWFAKNPHKDDCYQSEMRRRFLKTGLWCEKDRWWKPGSDYNVTRKHEDRIRKQLCRERNLSYPNGCAVHCDCNRDKMAEKVWERIGGHLDSCRFVQPNFLFKPSGFRIMWYKYPFRDSYMSENLSPKQWREIVRTCIASAKP